MDQKKPNFLAWYYNGAVMELLEIWKNFLVFVWNYFSIFEMLKTLLSPWRRDVSAGGFALMHPLRSLELLLTNTITRLMGAFVRLWVMAIGLFFFGLTLLLGFLLIIFWVAAPLVLAVLFLYTFNGTLTFLQTGAIFLIWLAIVIQGYVFDNETPLWEMDPRQLAKQPIFARICGRMGLTKEEIPVEILDSPELMSDFLKKHNLNTKDYKDILQNEFILEMEKEQRNKFWLAENLQKHSPIGRHWRFGFTYHLDKYSTDLSEGDYSDYAQAELIGRQSEYEVLRLILTRPDQNCVLVVGTPGIGKKTLVHELARNIRTSKEKGQLGLVRILSLDLGRAISDAINKGEDVENFLRTIFYEASFAGNVILVIEHLENFLGGSDSAFHPDISPVLAEFLEVTSFRLIAQSTPKEYHRLIEKQEHIAKYFEVIEMSEPTEEETVLIMLSQLKKYETKRVLFTHKALTSIVRDSGRHSWEFPLPERALDLAMDCLMFWEKKSEEAFITEKTLADYMSLKTGVAHGEVAVDERRKLLDLEKDLHKLVIGQNEAISQVAEALRRARSGIGDSKKPVGSFLFLGPTGVGKTETAKALAKTYFGDENRMIRLDMSEFQTPSSLDRLLGSPQLNTPGRLVTQIKDNPYSLLLLDEIEKAYPEILDIFLQILDEGYVTDAFGEKINFRNTIIIATSNAGAALIKNMVAQNAQPDEIKQAVIDWTIENSIFRTEFLNRFEGVIFFRPLDETELVSVVRLQLQKVARRLESEKNIEITFDEKIIKQIIAKGYNPIFGARSLNRFIENEVEGIIAKKLIAGEVSPGEAIALSF